MFLFKRLSLFLLSKNRIHDILFKDTPCDKRNVPGIVQWKIQAVVLQKKRCCMEQNSFLWMIQAEVAEHIMVLAYFLQAQ